MNEMVEAAVGQTQAAWVQAYGAIGAIVAALLIVAIQAFNQRRRDAGDRRVLKETIEFVLDQCVAEYRSWSAELGKCNRDKLVEETISLRHLDVPLESLLTSAVGDVSYNRALMQMRKVNADVFIQIEKARRALDGDAGAAEPALTKAAARVNALVLDAERIRASITS